MATLELILLLLAAVLVSAVLDQFIPKVTSPLIQIAMGLAIALYAEGQIDVELDPELFLVLFVAPLLYNDAREADKGALWKTKRPVLSLAIGLVIVTALIVGFAGHALIPAIPLTAAIALGAALGPTDAVAVASLPKTLNIGEREQSILKGECLINDASGIVSFQFAVAACIYGAFSLVDAGIAFLVSFFGGILVGFVLGALTNIISNGVRQIGLDSTTFHVLFDVFTPFIVFLAAEPLGASGVIAVVTAGLVSTMGKRQLAPSVSRLNIVSNCVWHVFSFGLNGIVFVLLGTQLPKAMESTWESLTFDNGFLITMVLLIALLVELVRFLWLLGCEAVHARHQQKPPLTKGIVKSAALMTLAGAKGTVTLSIAFSLPLFNAFGGPFPQRQLIIFLASGVILITLLLANFCIPMLAGTKKTPANDAQRRAAEREAFIDVLRDVIEQLAHRVEPRTRRATQAVIKTYNDRIDRLKTSDTDDEDDPVMVKLRLKVLQWEREYAQNALALGHAKEETVDRVLLTLDRRERLLLHDKVSATAAARLNRWSSFLKASRNDLMDSLPLVSVSEEAADRQQLYLQCAHYANHQLRDLLKNSGDIPTEYVSALLMESNRAIRSLQPRMPSITRITANDEAVDNVLRHALALEMEGINAMQEEGRISHAYAKRLLENVALMQLDLEEKIYK